MWPPDRKQPIALGICILEQSAVPFLSSTSQSTNGKHEDQRKYKTDTFLKHHECHFKLKLVFAAT